jgi:O-methyltransferase involved in polyketide biosynthesis
MSVAKDSARQSTKERVVLSGVSETALLTLNARAREARRDDPVIDDPMAIALVDSIDFDFTKFGRTGQNMALRACLRYPSPVLSRAASVGHRGGAG